MYAEWSRPGFDDLEKELRHPTHERIFAIADAFKRGYPVERIYQLTSIDKWFLFKLQKIVATAENLKQHSLQDCRPRC